MTQIDLFENYLYLTEPLGKIETSQKTFDELIQYLPHEQSVTQG